MASDGRRRCVRIWCESLPWPNSAAEAEPTVDPGEIINRRAHALEKSGHARSFAEAVEIAMRQLPEEAAAYQAL